MVKLTEDETIKLLMAYLERKGWKINSYCFGHKRGRDIVASKSDCLLIVEAKGARASDSSPVKKRKHFDSGQIKTHFGKALVKVMEEKYLNPNVNVAIAHPDDIYIRKSIGALIPFINSIGINHYWVSANGKVIEGK